MQAARNPLPMNRVVEFRSYNLKPGTRDQFARLFWEQARPMLARWGVDVIAAGPSLHDENSFCLIRSYASLEDRGRSQDAFYGSDEWRQGPREAIVACIENYASVVLSLDEDTIAGLRRSHSNER